MSSSCVDIERKLKIYQLLKQTEISGSLKLPPSRLYKLKGFTCLSTRSKKFPSNITGEPVSPDITCPTSYHTDSFILFHIENISIPIGLESFISKFANKHNKFFLKK